MSRLAPLLLLTALPANAADWQFRDGDRPWSVEETSERLADTIVTFADGGRSIYGPGEAYAYVYDDGTRAEGRWDVMADGSVCVTYPAGFSRCDVYVERGDRLYLIDEDGARYPATSAEPVAR